VGELKEIIAKVHQRLQVYVTFVVPKGADESWRESSLRSDAQPIPLDAQLIPNVKTLFDEDGVEAARFNAKTSGQVILDLLHNPKSSLRGA
jgi:hypothetical protein